MITSYKTCENKIGNMVKSFFLFHVPLEQLQERTFPGTCLTDNVAELTRMQGVIHPKQDFMFAVGDRNIGYGDHFFSHFRSTMVPLRLLSCAGFSIEPAYAATIGNGVVRTISIISCRA